MYAYVTADTYKTKVPWKGKMTKVYWNGDREVEDVEGIYEAIKIMDINVNYGRMTPLSQSAFEDNGASKEGASEVNMQARDRLLGDTFWESLKRKILTPASSIRY